MKTRFFSLMLEPRSNVSITKYFQEVSRSEYNFGYTAAPDAAFGSAGLDTHGQYQRTS